MQLDIKKILVITAAFFWLLPMRVFAFDMPEVIRIGLHSRYKAVDSVAVANNSIAVGYRSDAGYTRLGVLTAASSFSARLSGAYYVEAAKDCGSFEDAFTRAEAYKNFGHSAAVAFKATGGLSVYTGPYSSKAEADAAAESLLGTVTVPSDARVLISDGSSPAAILDGAGLEVSDGLDGIISLGERKYRGGIEFMSEGSKLTAVNVLSVEEYLYSVVPSEMPSGWAEEALKAQAVAARTYSLTRMSAHQSAGYHFCDLVHCQNYLGAGNEADSTTAAVNATAGVLAYYNGEPINAVYFSSSGGATEDSENTWTEAVPYLRAVWDTYEVSGMQWERTFTLGEIQALLKENIGTVTKVAIGRTSATGRVQELVIHGTGGTSTLTKEYIRTFFLSSDGGMLESRNFNMQGGSVSGESTRLSVANASTTLQAALTDLYAVSASGEAVRLSSVTAVGKDTAASYQATTKVVTGGSSQGNLAVFTGSGWGHGVGMSQYGAKDMAEAGHNYIQILQHYYTGIEVR